MRVNESRPDLIGAGAPADEIEITPEMSEAGYVAYLTERRRLEDGDDEDRRIAFTSIFRAIWQARR
jgi:hypothetical protein